MQLFQLSDGVAEGQAPPGGRALAQVGRMPQAGVPPAELIRRTQVQYFRRRSTSVKAPW